jgi:predicted nucleic acid-binding protein
LRIEYRLAAKCRSTFSIRTPDRQRAAIARRHNLTIATGNVKDFQRQGIKVFDPFAES